MTLPSMPSLHDELRQSQMEGKDPHVEFGCVALSSSKGVPQFKSVGYMSAALCRRHDQRLTHQLSAVISVSVRQCQAV